MIVVFPGHTHLLLMIRPPSIGINKFVVFVDKNLNNTSFQRYTGYINFINDPISHVLLLIRVRVLLPSCLYF